MNQPKTPQALPILRLSDLKAELAQHGIVKKQVESVQLLSELDQASLNEKQRAQLRFAPRTEVVRMKNDSDLWFRSRGTNWVSVFVLLPGDLVLLTAEYMTGTDMINISPCARVAEKNEPLSTCALREVREESGIVLERVRHLSAGGLPVSARKSTEIVFPYLGYPKIDEDGKVVQVERKLDENEDLLAFLMPLADYWEFLSTPWYDNAVVGCSTGYAALRHLGKLTMA